MGFAFFVESLSSFHWQPSTIKPILHKEVDFTLPAGHTVAFFDGAAKSTWCCCGAGGFFKMHPERTTKWFLCCGRGSNTKAELLGLWATLLLASFWSLDHIQVFGDSKVIIDWINHKCDLHSTHVEGWKAKTQLLASTFSDISFRHLPRTFNSEADVLSKNALSHEVGRLYLFHCDRGQASSTTYLNLFELNQAHCTGSPL
jgi:ribonuclease HI